MNSKRIISVFIISCLIGVFSGNAFSDEHIKPPDVGEIRPGILFGYLPFEVTDYGVGPAAGLPDSSFLVPPPPAPGSFAYAYDQAYNEACVALYDTIRWDLATADDNLQFPEAANTFSCALNAQISEDETPFLYHILRRTVMDAGISTYPGKYHYERPRPFTKNTDPICAGDREELLTNWAYPSGHTAIGWAWALILSEIAPDRANQILARGLAFGESRGVCNVHWHSDIQWGRTMASAVVAQLHANDEFRSHLEQAKIEYANIQGEGPDDNIDCSLEGMSMAIEVEESTHRGVGNIISTRQSRK